MNKYDKGFISLYRQFKNWRYYKNDNIKSVFIHCLLSAYWKDEVISEYHGKKINPPIEIPKGSFITSRRKLADDLEKTDGEIQEALRKLSGYKRCTKKNTNTYTNINDNEITLLCTSQYTVVTINNFNVFQEYIEVSAPGKENVPMLSVTPSDAPTITPQLNNIYLNKDKKIKRYKDKSTDVHSSNLNSLTLKLLNNDFITDNDIPEMYDKMFDELLEEYDLQHMNVVLDYVVRKMKNKKIKNKYFYLKKSLSINLEKMSEIMSDDKTVEEENPTDDWTPMDKEELSRMIEELQKGEHA